MIKRWRRHLRKTLRTDSKKLAICVGLVLTFFVSSSGLNPLWRMSHSVDPTVYAPLLDTVAKGESLGNYNAHFGNSLNSEIKFTEMTVGEVMKWQSDYVKKGSPSSAVGRYQIISPTLKSLVEELDIDKNDRFDEKLQDKMAVALLERRGAEDYIENKLPRDEFAANLAKEWAALPKVKGQNPGESFYANDGLNKVQLSIDEVYEALDEVDSRTNDKGPDKKEQEKPTE